jgi:hypothetical protein
MQLGTISLAALLCLSATACKNRNPIRLEQTIEESQPLVSALRFSEQSRTDQLVKGFFDLQANAWRWTAPQFEVVLAAPAGAKTKGANLVLEFDLPDPTIDALKNITVSARVNRETLAPETYSTTGQHEYRREIPASAILSPEVVVDFSVDKFLVPPGDGRHLALVVSAVALEPKLEPKPEPK